jgi:hypothetical protein
MHMLNDVCCDGNNPSTVFSLLEALSPTEALVVCISFRAPKRAIEAQCPIRSATLLGARRNNHFSTITILKTLSRYHFSTITILKMLSCWDGYNRSPIPNRGPRASIGTFFSAKP